MAADDTKTTDRRVMVVACGDCGKELATWHQGDPLPLVDHTCAIGDGESSHA